MTIGDPVEVRCGRDVDGSPVWKPAAVRSIAADGSVIAAVIEDGLTMEIASWERAMVRPCRR